jgi:hypothetical protein
LCKRFRPLEEEEKKGEKRKEEKKRRSGIFQIDLRREPGNEDVPIR